MQSDFHVDPQPYGAVWYRMMKDVPRRPFYEPDKELMRFKEEFLRMQLGIHPWDQAPTSFKQRKLIQNAIKQTVRIFDDLVANMIMEFLEDRCGICERHLAVGVLSDAIRTPACHACRSRYNCARI